MKAQELRIGNWVHQVDPYVGFPWDIEMTIHHFDKRYLTEDLIYPYFTPIPLTEEWLLKFGFEAKGNYTKHGNGQDWTPEYPQTMYTDYVIDAHDEDYFFLRYEVMIYQQKNGELDAHATESVHKGSWYKFAYESIPVKFPLYVHQLQNLYFALTGEELTINE
jgi:hypothetical protein